MVQNRQVTLLGDSILKGIQVDLGDRRYRTHNEINVEALESEFQLSIHNDAHFGATVRKGSRLLDRMLARKLPCDMMVMDFGGNDCDFRWKEIAEDPTGDHQPNVPLPEFVELYREMIRRARSHGIRPILTNLPPLDSERFFNWWCGDLDKEAVMRWLGDVGNIYVWSGIPVRWNVWPGRKMCRWWMSEEPFWTTAIWSRLSAPMVPTPTPSVRA